jgi:hypothetical protein
MVINPWSIQWKRRIGQMSNFCNNG